jgi:hypothetical protein
MDFAELSRKNGSHRSSESIRNGPRATERALCALAQKESPFAGCQISRQFRFRMLTFCCNGQQLPRIDTSVALYITIAAQSVAGHIRLKADGRVRLTGNADEPKVSGRCARISEFTGSRSPVACPGRRLMLCRGPLLNLCRVESPVFPNLNCGKTFIHWWRKKKELRMSSTVSG